jgi:hypothetical protein
MLIFLVCIVLAAVNSVRFLCPGCGNRFCPFRKEGWGLPCFPEDCPGYFMISEIGLRKEIFLLSYSRFSLLLTGGWKIQIQRWGNSKIFISQPGDREDTRSGHRFLLPGEHTAGISR